MEAMRKTGSCLKAAAIAAAAKPSSASRTKWLPRRSIVPSPSATTNKFVFLHKWWLVKVNGKDLAVGGFTEKDQRVSLFQSAAIMKRHDTTTLETADGMTVMLSGLIDQLRTNENGFPNEVCHRFMLGFPLDWEKYSREDLAGTFTSDEHKLHSGDFPGDVSSISLYDVPAARIRDLMFGLADGDNDLLMRNICNNVLKELGKTQSEQAASANCETSAKGKEEIEKVAAGEARGKHKSASRVEQTGTNEEEALALKSGRKGGPRSGKRSKIAAAIVPSRVSTRSMTGVSTRSMTRWR